MRKMIGLAMLPLMLAATQTLAMAEKQYGADQQWGSTTTTKTTTTQMMTNKTGMGTNHTAMTDPRVNPMWAKGQWNLAVHKYPEAINTFQNILSSDPSNVHALKGLSTAFCQQGRYDEALTQINKAIALDPVNPQLFYTKGMILDAQDKPIEAVESYLTFTSLNPDDGAALTALNRVDDLWKQAEPKLTEGSQNYLQGLKMLSLHQPDQAIALFTKYQTIEPNNQQASLLLGKAYMEMGQPDKAIPYFESALKLKADNPVAYYQLGSSYEMTGKTQNATDAWKKFVQYAPQSEQAMTINRRWEWTQQ